MLAADARKRKVPGTNRYLLIIECEYSCPGQNEVNLVSAAVPVDAAHAALRQPRGFDRLPWPMPREAWAQLLPAAMSRRPVHIDHC